MNKDNGCEDLLKLRKDRGEFYTKKKDVRHQNAELKEVKRTRERGRDVNRNEV